jgi:hypothetical protein
MEKQKSWYQKISKIATGITLLGGLLAILFAIAGFTFLFLHLNDVCDVDFEKMETKRKHKKKQSDGP